MKKITTLFTLSAFFLANMLHAANDPKPTDNLDGNHVQDVSFFNDFQYAADMINGGGSDVNSDNNYLFSRAYFKTVGDKTYVLVKMEINDTYDGEIVDGNDDSFVKAGGLYLNNGGNEAKVVGEKDAPFKYIYIDANGDYQFCVDGACGTNKIVGYSATFNNTIVGTDVDYPDKTSSSYFENFNVHANVDYNTDGLGEGRDGYDTFGATSATCRGDNCVPICLTCGDDDDSTPRGNIPIDGGLGILALAGLGFGLYKKRK